MHMKLLDIENLARGTERQRLAHVALRDLRVFDLLREYSPVLAGTIPLDIDIESSDLDVICSAEDLEVFAERLRTHFGAQAGFVVRHTVIDDLPAVLARFTAHGFPIEIFAQSRSVFTQPAVVHMLVEARLLAFAPAGAREKIRELKRGGAKTEPAFAECFGLQGDPYEELLKLARATDRELLMTAHQYLWLWG